MKKQIFKMISWIVFFLFLPIMVVSFYFASLSSQEAEDFLSSPNFHTDQLQHGKRYRLQGEVAGELLNPKYFPEVKKAVSYRAIRQVFEGGQWKKSCESSHSCPRGKVKDLSISYEENKKTVIVVTPGSYFYLPVQESFREIDKKNRWWIRYKTLPKQVGVWGTYEHGLLSDGLLDRLYIFPTKDREEFFQSLEVKGKRKSQWLNRLGFLLLFSMLISLGLVIIL